MKLWKRKYTERKNKTILWQFILIAPPEVKAHYIVLYYYRRENFDTSHAQALTNFHPSSRSIGLGTIATLVNAINDYMIDSRHKTVNSHHCTWLSKKLKPTILTGIPRILNTFLAVNVVILLYHISLVAINFTFHFLICYYSPWWSVD